MKARALLVVSALGALLACSPVFDAADQRLSGSSEAGSKFTFDRAPNVDANSLPSNSDFRMVDLDLEKYAVSLCGLDLPESEKTKACDVYVQTDKSGALVGYIALKRGGDGVWISSALSLGGQLSNQHCGIDGKLSRSREPGLLTAADAGRDFNARVAYLAWEKEPGNWLVSADDGTGAVFDKSNGAMGMWYFERKGDNLRVEQERWNYCYSDSKVYIDDVYRRVISVTRRAR